MAQPKTREVREFVEAAHGDLAKVRLMLEANPALAGRLDQGRDRRPSRQESGLSYSPSQIAVRCAYLEELPWGTPAARERGFDVAMCLSPVQRASEHLMYFTSMGREYLACPEGGIEKHSKIAEFLKVAMRRREMMLQPSSPSLRFGRPLDLQRRGTDGP